MRLVVEPGCGGGSGRTCPVEEETPGEVDPSAGDVAMRWESERLDERA